MTETTEQPQTTELSLRDHAFQEIDAVAAGITALTERYKNVVFDVTTTKGMEDAKKARAEIREPRYAVERIRKGKASELRAIASEINERAAAITNDVMAIEGPIQAQIEAEEERKAAIRAERERAEQTERDRQVQLIASIARLPVDLMDATVDELDAATHELLTRALPLNEVYLPDGQRTRDEVIASLQVLRTRRAEADDRVKELERLRDEAKAREAELEEQRKQEAAERAQRDADERERRERDEAVSSAINDIRAYAHAGATSAGIREAMDELAKVEINADRFGDRVEAAGLARSEASNTLANRLEQATDAERIAAEQAERQRQLDAQAEEQRVAAEAAARAAEEQRQAEELAEAQRALEAQREAIRNATAEQAMQAALALLQREGYGLSVEAQMLASALHHSGVEPVTSGRTED